jgi:hypothetical protein
MDYVQQNARSFPTLRQKNRQRFQHALIVPWDSTETKLEEQGG